MTDWIDLAFGPVRWQVHPQWRDRLFDNHGLRFTEWQRNGDVAIVKQAPHRAVYRIALPLTTHHSPLTIYVKHYPLNDLRAYFRQAVRPAKARGEALKAMRLAALGIPTVEPVAIGAVARGESWLITRGLDDVQQLNHFMENVAPQLSAEESIRLRAALADALAEMLAKPGHAWSRYGTSCNVTPSQCRTPSRIA